MSNTFERVKAADLKVGDVQALHVGRGRGEELRTVERIEVSRDRVLVTFKDPHNYHVSYRPQDELLIKQRTPVQPHRCPGCGSTQLSWRLTTAPTYMPRAMVMDGNDRIAVLVLSCDGCSQIIETVTSLDNVKIEVTR